MQSPFKKFSNGPNIQCQRDSRQNGQRNWMSLLNCSAEAISTAAVGPSPMSIPSDAVRPGGKYEVQGFVWNSICKTYLKVYVSQVYSPEKFYFQLIENEGLLASLMSEMQMFYNSDPGESYKVMPDDLVLGLPVAARFRTEQGNIWHRGLISGSVDLSKPGEVVIRDNMAEVFYVDYGTNELAALDNIRLLKKKFLVHYAQAIRGRLACVQPPDLETDWSNQAIDLMMRFVTNRPLICEVVGVEECSFSVNLCDTSKPNVDIYLNDLLVDKNLAERAPAPFPTVVSLAQQCYF